MAKEKDYSSVHIRNKSKDEIVRQHIGIIQDNKRKASEEVDRMVNDDTEEMRSSRQRGFEAGDKIELENIRYLIHIASKFNISRDTLVRELSSVPHSQRGAFKFEMFRLGVNSPENFRIDFIRKTAEDFIRRYGLDQYRKLGRRS
jgi:hypothetical protein